MKNNAFLSLKGSVDGEGITSYEKNAKCVRDVHHPCFFPDLPIHTKCIFIQ